MTSKLQQQQLQTIATINALNEELAKLRAINNERKGKLNSAEEESNIWSNDTTISQLINAANKLSIIELLK